MLSSNYDRWAKKTGVDILLVNKGINFFETKNVLKNLKDAGLNYKIIEWMHCRELAPGTGERYNGVLKRVLPTYV